MRYEMPGKGETGKTRKREIGENFIKVIDQQQSDFYDLYEIGECRRWE